MKPTENRSEPSTQETSPNERAAPETAHSAGASSVRNPGGADFELTDEVAECVQLIERVRKNSPHCLADVVADSLGPMWLGEETGRLVRDAPKEIGGFQLEEVLGQGGFGVVFRAIDPKLGRQVALKIPRIETLLTDEDRQRFMLEAMTVSTLNHPNIATVFEAGHDGAVYFIVSPYYPGGSLADVCASGGPCEMRAAATLIKTLAGAMHHAHRRGILHRDLKPGNILFDLPARPDALSESNADAARIVDFGLASHDERTQHLTQTGALIGTPSYMSPEQARGWHSDVTTASDIYSLGAVLYELLTGHPPHDQASVLATLDAVRSDEPVPPRKCRPGIPRDLEAICLKCLEKSPDDRYLSAVGLADDLTRWLDGDSVSARPPSAFKKASRWCRRHPAKTALGASVLLGSVAIATIASIAYWQVASARNDLSDANRALRRSRDVEAIRAKRLRESLDAQISIVLEDLLSRQAKLTDDHRKYLKTALASYEQFAEDRGQSRAVRFAVARAFKRVAEIRATLGEVNGAAAAYRSAIDRFGRLSAAGRPTPDLRYEQVEAQLGLAQLLTQLDQVDAAEASIRTALEGSDRLTSDHPRNDKYRRQRVNSLAVLGNILKNRRRTAEAEAIFRQAIGLQKSILARHPGGPSDRVLVSKLLGSHAQTLAGLGRFSDAERVLRTARDIQAQLVNDFPQDAAYQEVLAHQLEGLAFVLLRQKKPQDAEAILHEQLELRSSLARDFPSKPEFQVALVACYVNFGTLFAQTGRSGEAQNMWRSGEATARALVADHPGVPYHHYGLANVLLHLARMSLANNNPTAALELAREGSTELDIALRANPDRPDFRRTLSERHEVLAQVLAAAGRVSEAAGAAEQLLASPLHPVRSPFVAAQVFARCAVLADDAHDSDGDDDDDDDLAEHYRDRALFGLSQAVDHGFTDAASVVSDPDLRRLTGRSDMKQLLARMKRLPAAR